jgi:hypothetical protein
MKNWAFRGLSLVCCSQLLMGSNSRADWSFEFTGRYLPRAFSKYYDYGNSIDYTTPPFGMGFEYHYGPALARLDLVGSIGLGYMPTKNWALVGEYFYLFGPRYALLTAYQFNLTGLHPDIFVKPRIGLISSKGPRGSVVDLYTGFDVGFHWYSGSQNQTKGTNWVAYGILGGFLVFTIVGSIVAIHQLNQSDGFY